MRYDRLTVVLLLAFVGSQGTLAATSRVTAAPAAPAALHEAGLATPSIRSTAHGQLPPDILLDSYLLRAEEAVRQRDHAAARAAMERIAALQEAHVLETVAEYHYRYASVWNGVAHGSSLASAVRYLELTGRDRRTDAHESRSLASAVRYLELTGRDGNHYSDALTLMNRATAAIEEGLAARPGSREPASCERRRKPEHVRRRRGTAPRGSGCCARLPTQSRRWGSCQFHRGSFAWAPTLTLVAGTQEHRSELLEPSRLPGTRLLNRNGKR